MSLKHIFLCLVLLTLALSGTSSAWWNTSYTSYKEVNITQSNTGTTYYLNLTLWNTSTFPEIRFTTNSSGTETQCGGWWKQKNLTANNEWNVNCTLSQGTTAIRAYYNNNTASTDISSGQTATRFFDDFSGVSLNATKWTDLLGSTITVSGGIIEVAKNTVFYSGIASTSNFNNGSVVRSYCKTTTTDTIMQGFSTNTQGGYATNSITTYVQANSTFKFYNYVATVDKGLQTGITKDANYHMFTHKWYAVPYHLYDSTETTSPNAAPTAAMAATIRQGGTITCDWIAVYDGTENRGGAYNFTYSLWGSETNYSIPTLTTSLANANETENKTITMSIVDTYNNMSAYNLSVTYNNTVVYTSSASGLTNTSLIFNVPIVAPLVSTNNTNISWNVSVNVTRSDGVYNLTSAGNQSVQTWWAPVSLLSPTDGSLTSNQNVDFSALINSTNFNGTYKPATCLFNLNGNNPLSSVNYTSETTFTTTQYLPSGLTVWNFTCAPDDTPTFNRSSETYTVQITSIEEQFNDYLNISLSSCSAGIQTNLSSCNEFYKLTRIYNYSAIVCPIPAQNLTCLGATINNYTKNNYTIIYSPASWVYAGGLANITGLEHTGAIFYTGGAAINPGIELINSTHFVYLPAQTKDRDCTIKYLATDTTTNCSYANGFVINNRQIIAADRQGYFYTAGGLAVVSYNTNYSNMVIPVSLLPLQFWYTTHPETGLFTKMHCMAVNNTYTIDLINTVSKAFVVTVTGTGATTYSGSGQSYYKQIAIGNDTNISITADGYLVCSHAAATFTFMNINLSFINSDMLGYLYKMLAIFLVVISSVSPYFLFGFILFNDMFSTFTVYQVGVLTGFTVMLSLINNYQSTERGLKHVAMLFFIFAGFLVVFAPYWGNASGVNFAAITAFQDSFAEWQSANNMADMTWNAINVIIQFFLLILSLPALIVDLVFSLINVVMPALAQGFNGLRQPIALAFTVFVYIKAYEIITKQYRGV